MLPGVLARGVHLVVEARLDAHLIHPSLNFGGAARGVGEHDDALAVAMKLIQALQRMRESGDTIVEHAPKVANEGVIALGEGGEAVENERRPPRRIYLCHGQTYCHRRAGKQSRMLLIPLGWWRQHLALPVCRGLARISHTGDV